MLIAETQSVERQDAHDHLLDKLSLFDRASHEHEPKAGWNRLGSALNLFAAPRDNSLQRRRILDAGYIELHVKTFSPIKDEVGSHKGAGIVQINQRSRFDLSWDQEADLDISCWTDSRVFPSFRLFCASSHIGQDAKGIPGIQRLPRA